MTNVDGWMIPNEQLAAYLRDREACAERLDHIMKARGLTVRRYGQGSEDGEMVAGFDAAGQMVMMEHLDPGTVRIVTQMPDDAALLAFLTQP